MDNKRVVLATVLCLVILIAWNFVAERLGWLPTPPAPAPQVVEQVQPGGVASTMPVQVVPATPIVPAARFAPSEGRLVKVETPLYIAVFHSAGGILQEFKLKNYRETIAENSPLVDVISPVAATVAPMGLLVNGQPSWSTGQWAFEGQDLNLSSGQSESLVFRGVVDGVHLTRTITFFADTYVLRESVGINTEATKAVKLSYTVATTSLTTIEDAYNATRVAWNKGGSFDEDTDVKDLTAEGLLETGLYRWAGTMSNYFMAVVAPEGEQNVTLKVRIQDNIWRVALENPDMLVNAGQPLTLAANWWFGPKERDLLETAPGELSLASDYGMFTFLALPLLWLLSSLYSLCNNWGLAILLLTVLIKIAFWPLTRKSYTSMEKMKKIQPMVKEIQKKYASDKEALTRETMQLYKTYGVNPMGGCLPILLQLPVFLALYQALLHTIELRHSAFIPHLPFTDIVWLADLSAKDPLYITPIVMGATMFLQQWMAPAMGDPMQRRMMLLLPLVFTFMFVSFPSGLVLYWMCNNVLSIAQQWWTLRNIPS